ncbi:uncharacterized protein LOC126413234 [Schistocerca serialis cubense]|uniref:uncharacterized protein LOC126413234 n=1 Tax=Schistocerca serialis cubense TaxID=2023355 RepID=UPI00214E08B4|nr:uncharacterized protein LOC126413234 [Schistocerca serialis cubense]
MAKLAAALLALSLLGAAAAPESPLRPAVAERFRRSLVFPMQSGIVQLLIGFGTPIPIPRNAMTLGLVMKYTYNVPVNGSVYLQPYSLLARRNSRWSIYTTLSDFLTRLGIDGRNCLLRAICEAAEKPFTRVGGLAEDILHILLTPSSTVEDTGELPEREFHAAERHGKSDRGCDHYRRTCDFDLLALISSLHHDHDHGIISNTRSAV